MKYTTRQHIVLPSFQTMVDDLVSLNAVKTSGEYERRDSYVPQGEMSEELNEEGTAMSHREK